jgi:NADH:ubiquinone oxidoreductase subunit 4 (subunit M)
VAKGVKIWGLGGKIEGGWGCRVSGKLLTLLLSQNQKAVGVAGAGVSSLAIHCTAWQKLQENRRTDHDGQNERLQETLRFQVLEITSKFSYQLVVQGLCLLLITLLFLISYHISCIRSSKMAKNCSRNKSVQ